MRLDQVDQYDKYWDEKPGEWQLDLGLGCRFSRSSPVEGTYWKGGDRKMCAY